MTIPALARFRLFTESWHTLTFLRDFCTPDSSTPPWGGTADRGAKPPSQTAAHTDKWSPQPEPRRADSIDSPITEPATSARPSLDDGQCLCL